MLIRHGLCWYYSENDDFDCVAIPWWLGFVRYLELRREFAPMPLNFLLAWWHWTIRGIQYRWTPTALRWTSNRAALWRAFERGRRAGKNQGRAEAICFLEDLRRRGWTGLEK
jgi:hypothetical protein